MDEFTRLENIFDEAKEQAKKLHDSSPKEFSAHLEKCIWLAMQGATHAELLAASRKPITDDE